MALAFAGALLVGAYLYSTTGWGTPFPGCWTPVAQPYADLLGAVYGLLGISFAFAALRDPTGLDLSDRLLLTTVLATAFVFLVTGAIYTLVNGVARIGQAGCIVIGPPLSDIFALVAIIVAAVPLVGAVAVAVGRGIGTDD